MRQHGEAGNPAPESPNVTPGSGVSGFGVEFWHPIDFTQNNFQFRDTVTMNRGTHSFRAGGEWRLGIDGTTWAAAVWAKNLTDKQYNAEWSPGPMFFPNPGYTNNFVFKAMPRRWGADLNYRF